MSRILFSILCFMAINICTAQSVLQITPDSSFLMISSADEDVKVPINITNTSDELVVVAWERIVVDMPEAWETYICSELTCLPPEISFGTFGLLADSMVNLDNHFLPNGQPGEGLVKLRVFITSDMATTYELTFHSQIIEPVAIVEVGIPSLSFYPNPTKDYFILESEEQLESVQLLDMNGRLLKNFDSTKVGLPFNIADLTMGNYIVRVFSRGGKQSNLLLSKI